MAGPSKATMTGIYGSRRRAAMKAAAKAGARNLLVGTVEDVSYLTGFSGDDSVLLIAPAGAWLLTDGRYDEQARTECPGVEVYVRQVAMPRAIAEVMKKARLTGKLAVQAEHMTLRTRQLLEEQIRPRKVLPLPESISALRQVKDATEIKAIRKAIFVAEEAFRSLMADGKKAFVGRSERRIAAEMDYRMRLAGSDKPAFETIVAVGAHGSLPHYRPAETVAQEGQPVMLDWGATVAGYVSDLTRVVFLGTIPPKLAELYQIVARSQEAGMAALKHNASAKAVDAAARDVIAAAGYGQQFIHSLGHGIGRVVHELPSLSRLSEAKVKAGMVVTVEPGIYLPGQAGVRLEDDVEVTAGGCRRLSTLPRQIEQLLLP